MAGLDPIESRAHWQQSEGMVVFDRVFKDVFPRMIDDVQPRAVATDILRRTALASGDAAQFTPLDTAFITGQHVEATMTALPRSTQNHNDEALLHFTYSGMATAIREGVNTTVYFPLNILNYVNAQRPNDTADMTGSLAQIAEIVRGPSMERVCHTAAFAPNGIWRGFTTKVFSDVAVGEIFPQLTPILDFTYDKDQSFDFSSTAKRHLRAALAARNGTALARYPKDNEDVFSGTSSGCPVARLKPSFSKHPLDDSRLTQLAERYQTSPESLLEPREETAISFGLRQFAGLLDKVNAVLVQKQLARA